ncbi:hypothetical protein MPER_15898, partial [Moniliophthora perniciosa FA553]
SKNAGGKRRPNRKANTAERRATHNAVERQRRETLNDRFLSTFLPGEGFGMVFEGELEIIP